MTSIIDSNQLIRHVILLISDLCEILNSIKISNDFDNSAMFSAYKCCSSLYKIYDYYSLITYIIKKNINNNDIVTSKVCELIHCIFNNFTKKEYLEIYLNLENQDMV